MNKLIREISAEAHEICENIRNCDELTYQQRNELLELVMTDVNEKLELARNLLYAWTGSRTDSPKGGAI